MANPATFYHSFYLGKRTYVAGAALVLLFIISFYVPALLNVGKAGLAFLCFAILVDVFILYRKKEALQAQRITSPRFSNGDDNKVVLVLNNQYNFIAEAEIIDELPIQFQFGKMLKRIKLQPESETELEYIVKPYERGEYLFGNIVAIVCSPLGLAKRKFSFPAAQTVQVYPSYVQMRRYSLQAVSNDLQETGTKRLRKSGQSVEFEQIKEYVRGDDYRTINWKASARKSQLMVNTYVDEKSQQIICLVDKSRSMKMPFDGLTLLDYAINAALVLSSIGLHKQDKTGLLTFAQKVDSYLPPERKSMQMEAVLETLYRQQTNFADASYEALYAYIRGRVKQRSLLVLFTNFESLYGLQRQMPYLKMIAHYHLLLVVFFENTEVKTLLHSPASNTEEIYIKTIAEKFTLEKRQMVKELQHQGILTLLTTPQQLTVNAINKYLEIKAQQML
ncbi:DUF58 domain-containing protein [Foetidibacter luteolus]|uniref:DUF58 domain-containing protein n=1 Tax=Foetidibacter luteolus TaxID=2608880 RepID=UPI00129AD718|nr:DUF58 domain-containing protein [Foetidibacter luteolus]